MAGVFYLSHFQLIAMAEREYTRLTRTHTRSGLALFIAWRSTLWVGADHLLCVDTNGYTENYKRFYFRDIQAISVRKTTRALVWTIMLAAMVALSIMIAFVVRTPGMDIVFWVIAGMLALLLALNAVGGHSCVCHLRTAVQTEELPPLNRVRRARKILKRIRPLIESAQGPIAAGDISSLMYQLTANPVSQQPESAARPSAPAT